MNKEINKERLNAFTDAIAAIAATIMVLNLGVPNTNDWSGILSQVNVLFAYIVSYMFIYLVWYLHHNLFKDAKVISVRAFLLNGLWLLFLTLVPFTTGWIGSAEGRSPAPRVIYALNTLLWALSFWWLESRVQKDNPEMNLENRGRSLDRKILYGGLSISFVLSFILRRGVVPMTGAITAIMIIRALLESEKRKTEETS